MRLTLTMFGLVAALLFGVLTVVGGMQNVTASGDDDSGGDDVVIFPCARDDGDNGDPGEDLPDDPDSEDRPGLGFLGGDPPEVGDPEDHDPYYEEDDCPAPLVPGSCGNMTAPGVYLFSDPNYGGECFYAPGNIEWIGNYHCCFNDVTSSMKIVGPAPFGVRVCLHAYYGGNCELVLGDLPNFNVLYNEECGATPPPICSLDNNLSSFYYEVGPPGAPGDVEPEASFAAADADCDGGVGVADALANLQYLSGFEAGCAGDWNGESYQGDADCSGAVEGGDVTAILVGVINGSAADC